MSQMTHLRILNYEKMVSDIMCQNEEEEFQAKAVQLSLQGNWMKC